MSLFMPENRKRNAPIHDISTDEEELYPRKKKRRKQESSDDEYQFNEKDGESSEDNVNLSEDDSFKSPPALKINRVKKSSKSCSSSESESVTPSKKIKKKTIQSRAKDKNTSTKKSFTVREVLDYVYSDNHVTYRSFEKHFETNTRAMEKFFNAIGVNYKALRICANLEDAIKKYPDLAKHLKNRNIKLDASKQLPNQMTINEIHTASLKYSDRYIKKNDFAKSIHINAGKLGVIFNLIRDGLTIHEFKKMTKKELNELCPFTDLSAVHIQEKSNLSLENRRAELIKIVKELSSQNTGESINNNKIAPTDFDRLFVNFKDLHKCRAENISEYEQKVELELGIGRTKLHTLLKILGTLLNLEVTLPHLILETFQKMSSEIIIQRFGNEFFTENFPQKIRKEYFVESMQALIENYQNGAAIEKADAYIADNESEDKSITEETRKKIVKPTSPITFFSKNMAIAQSQVDIKSMENFNRIDEKIDEEKNANMTETFEQASVSDEESDSSTASSSEDSLDLEVLPDWATKSANSSSDYQKVVGHYQDEHLAISNTVETLAAAVSGNHSNFWSKPSKNDEQADDRLEFLQHIDNIL